MRALLLNSRMRMNRMLTLACLFLLFAAAGCDNVVDSVRARMEPAVEPHVRVFAADERTTYAAALAALDQIDFRFTHGGPAQGEMEAISSITREDADARQVSLVAEFQAAGGGGTEITVRMKEIVETDSNGELGQGVESPLRDTPLYEVFFHYIDQGLAPKKAD
jgi:hypothetical protein